MIGQLLMNSFQLGATIALMAIGLTLIFSVLQIVNYSHGELYMFGASIAFLLFVKYQVTNYFVACIASVSAVALLGWVLDKVIFRRFHGNLMGGVVASIGFLMIFQNMMWPVLGGVPKSIPPVIFGGARIFGVFISWQRSLVVILSIVIIAGLALFIKYTRTGMAIRAVAQDFEAARVRGIKAHNICAVTFGISAGLAALAGALIAPLYLIEPPMGMMPLEFAFIVIILGGMGSILGPFIASFIIGIQYTFTSAFFRAGVGYVDEFRACHDHLADTSQRLDGAKRESGNVTHHEEIQNMLFFSRFHVCWEIFRLYG